MPLNRIQVSYQTGGAGTTYSFKINPRIYESADLPNQNRIQILHGAGALQKRAWDDRPRTLVWRGNLASSEVDSVFSKQLASVKPWEGTIKYFRFNDLDTINIRWPTSVAYKKARVIGVEVEPMEGGRLRYQEVRLIIQPEK